MCEDLAALCLSLSLSSSLCDFFLRRNVYAGSSVSQIFDGSGLGALVETGVSAFSQCGDASSPPTLLRLRTNVMMSFCHCARNESPRFVV